MWPLLLDYDKEECRKMLRTLELEAYSSIISAFRAQGDLTKDKKKSLLDLCSHLSVPPERHKAEIRRAVNDEKLATIADQISGSSVASEWALEGRRLIPLMPRLVPQTAFTALADNTANNIGAQNVLLPVPSATSRKDYNARVQDVDSLLNNDQKFQVNSQTSPADSPLRMVDNKTPAVSSTDLQNIPPNKSKLLDKDQLQMPSPSSNNVVVLSGRSIHVTAPGMDSSLDKPGRRKRSASVEVQSNFLKDNQHLPLTNSQVPKTTTATSGPRTLSIPIGGTPVQFTLTGSSDKSVKNTPSTSSTPQKVILVSTSCANLSSSLLPRTVVPIVKTVTTTSSTSSIPHTQLHSKANTLVVPVSSQSGGIISTTTSYSTLGNNTVSGVVSKAIISSTIAQSSIKQPSRQRVKQGIIVPVVGQTPLASSGGKTFQIKSGGKPSFHIKEGPGLKIIAQTVPGSSGSKIIGKTSGGTGGPPIVVVTKTASLTSGGQHSARVVNVLTTQANSKVLTTTSLALTKAGGSSGPTFVTVGQKGKQAALVKVSPSMSLPSSGGKPNVIVVQKAHMLQHSQDGNTNVVSFSAASTLQTSHKGSLASGNRSKHQIGLSKVVSSWSPTLHQDKITQITESSPTGNIPNIKKAESGSTDDNSEFKSTMLADLLQAAGILPGGSDDNNFESLFQPENTGESWKTDATSSTKQATSKDAPVGDLLPKESIQSQIKPGNILTVEQTKTFNSTSESPAVADIIPIVVLQETKSNLNVKKELETHTIENEGELDPKTGEFYSSSLTDAKNLVTFANAADANVLVNSINDVNIAIKSDDQCVISSVSHVTPIALSKNVTAVLGNNEQIECPLQESVVEAVSGDIVSTEIVDPILVQESSKFEDNTEIQETLVCEEVPFEDDAVQIEDLMVTIEDMASEVVETTESNLTEQTFVKTLESDEEIRNTSSTEELSTSIVGESEADNKVQNLSQELSGSSIFMITDSAGDMQTSEVRTVALPIPENPESGDEDVKLNANVDQTDASCSHLNSQEGSTTPTKRKRKPVTEVYSGGNAPHLSGWIRTAMGLLLKVMKFRGTRRVKGEAGASHWFLQPVTDDEAPGYSQIVKFPMDFSTIKKRLETQLYEDIADFHKDMILVKHNCELYNPPDHEARVDCDEIFNFYQQEYDRLTDKWVKTHLMSPQRKKAKV